MTVALTRKQETKETRSRGTWTVSSRHLFISVLAHSTMAGATERGEQSFMVKWKEISDGLVPGNEGWEIHGLCYMLQLEQIRRWRNSSQWWSKKRMKVWWQKKWTPLPFDTLKKNLLQNFSIKCPINIWVCGLWPKREISPGIKGRIKAKPVRDPGAGVGEERYTRQMRQWLQRCGQIKTACCCGGPDRGAVCGGQRTLTLVMALTGVLGHTATGLLTASESLLGG